MGPDLHVFAIDSPYNRAFVEFITRNFSDQPHFFVLMREKAEVKFTLPDQKNIIYLPAKNVSQYQAFYQLFNQAGRIFAHSLFEPALSVFANYPGQKKIMFIPWGSDLAPFIFRSEADRLDSRTRTFFHGSGPVMAGTTYAQMAATWDTWRKMNLVINRASHLLHLINFEQKVIKQVFGKELALLPFQYYNPVDFNLLEGDRLPANPEYRFKTRFNKVIQLAHSGNPANNHISLIDQLAALDRDDFCVVAPLSYGPPKVIELIAKYGREKLGERFFPLLEFLPPEEYATVMRQMDVLLINTFYSGALANMTAMLYHGGKVMLNRRNLSTHATFKSYGLDLPSIDSDDGKGQWLEEVFKPLDAETAAFNRDRIQTMVSEKKLTEMYAYLLEKIA